MTRREVITKAIARQLSWVQASEILAVSARHMRRLPRKVECWGMSAVMDSARWATAPQADKGRHYRLRGSSVLFSVKFRDSKGAGDPSAAPGDLSRHL